jgi:hypothetical protein
MPSIINAALSGGLISTGDTSGQLQLQTGGTTALTVTSGQLVGVGTTSPIEKFNVNGLITTTGQSATSYYIGNNNGGFIDYSSGQTRIGSQISSGASNIGFYTTSSGYTGITETLRLNANGVLALKGGNTGATGVGVAFPATQSSSTDANTLDDYEEGTWTPVLTSQTGSITSYTTASGTYTKIGNTVSVQVIARITSLGTAGGTLYLTLPFSPIDEYWAGSGCEVEAQGFVLSVFGNFSVLGFRKYENSTAAVAGGGFKIGAVYRIA